VRRDAQLTRLQGRYVGALRSLQGEERDRVKKLAKVKGVAEAVKLALSLREGRHA
jgi:hypothetical protein